jgi:hypothetical protein
MASSKPAVVNELSTILLGLSLVMGVNCDVDFKLTKNLRLTYIVSSLMESHH